MQLWKHGSLFIGNCVSVSEFTFINILVFTFMLYLFLFMIKEN